MQTWLYYFFSFFLCIYFLYLVLYKDGFEAGVLCKASKESDHMRIFVWAGTL